MGSGQARRLPRLQTHLHIDERHVVDGGKPLDCDRPAGLHVSSEITDLSACTQAGSTGIDTLLVSTMVMEMLWRTASQLAALCGRTSCMGPLDLPVRSQLPLVGILQATTHARLAPHQ